MLTMHTYYILGYAGKSNIEQGLVDQVVDTVNDYLGEFYLAWFRSGENKKVILFMLFSLKRLKGCLPNNRDWVKLMQRL